MFQIAILMGAITPEHGKVTIKAEDAIGVLGADKCRELGLI